MTDMIRKSDALAECLNGAFLDDVTEAIRSLPAVTVGVKPLVWEVNDDKRDGRAHYGHGILGHWYAVCRERTGAWVVMHFVSGKRVQVHNKDSDTFPTLEAAKAAAQADYTARILAALEPDPAAIREAALREAADVCTYVIKNIEILKADGETYETPRVHKVARGLVDVARQDILALAKGAAE